MKVFGKNLFRHYGDGRRANFPLCCILYFYIHILLYICSKRYVRYTEIRALNTSVKTGHINCLLHELLYYYHKYKPRWGRCCECSEEMLISHDKIGCGFCDSRELLEPVSLD